MKIKLMIATLMVLFGLMMLSVPAAFAVPPQPSTFYGAVTINGSNVPVGTKVSAVINGVEYSSTLTTMYQGNSTYGMLVPGDDLSTPAIEGGREGDSVFFRIGGVNASQTGAWHSGILVNLDLSFTPTAVTLASFSVTSRFGLALLEWQTANETNLVGFNIYRSESESGVKQKQNVELIPASNPGQMIGSSYQFEDNVSQGSHYFYWLETVDSNNNSQFYQMELTTPHLVYLPMLIK